MPIDNQKVSKRFHDSGKERWGSASNADFLHIDGFNLRRLLKDHGAPSIRLPREMIRHLGWGKRDFLWVTSVDHCLVIGKLKYENPTEVARDKVDEVRRLYGTGRSSNDSEGREGRNGDSDPGRSRSRASGDGGTRRGDDQD